MALVLSGGLETSEYWRQVRGEADDLIRESPLADWTISLRPKTTSEGQVMEPNPGEDASEPWYVSADHEAKELTVGVPGHAIGTEDGRPRNAAEYLVFDLLDELISPATDDSDD